MGCTKPRVIQAADIADSMEKLCISTCCNLPEENLQRIEAFAATEESEVGRQVLDMILENHRLAAREQRPACQDTGLAVVFLELGQDVHIEGGELASAINDGVRRGYEKGYLRKSVVDDPLFERKNTRDNTPAIIHTTVVAGDTLKITLAAKGGGAENMSAVAMMIPAAGVEGVRRFVVEQVRKAGSNPCPPVVVGVGIGGNFEVAPLLAKKALVRPMGSKNPNPAYAALEDELLEAINKLGIGPQGLGGSTTALAVHVEYAPCHIASMPVAVNLNCHVSPHQSITL
ncbi:MAG TPA: fumarate hydratase [Bacillota bacterium]|jgi:fumarate hydratase subunit alpha|nr:fumarate hydratase [Bacillota bacterium]HNY67422.1 fumarate hydratase [Bacillota bacterium]HOI36274.1 fumarate hydratase [Bacillota bacterium]